MTQSMSGNLDDGGGGGMFSAVGEGIAQVTERAESDARSEGFDGARAALDQAKNQNAWLNEQIDSGKLWMEPGIAEEAAKDCERAEEGVQQAATKAEQIGTMNGLGEYDIAQQLKHHFEQKANHPKSGAFALLEQLRIELLNLADTFRKAGQHYREQEDQIASDFEKGMK